MTKSRCWLVLDSGLLLEVRGSELLTFLGRQPVAPHSASFSDGSLRARHLCQRRPRWLRKWFGARIASWTMTSGA